MKYYIRKTNLGNIYMITKYGNIYDYLKTNNYKYKSFRGKKDLTYDKFNEKIDNIIYSSIEGIIIDTDKKTYKFGDTYQKDCKLDDLPGRNNYKKQEPVHKDNIMNHVTGVMIKGDDLLSVIDNFPNIQTKAVINYYRTTIQEINKFIYNNFRTDKEACEKGIIIDFDNIITIRGINLIYPKVKTVNEMYNSLMIMKKEYGGISDMFYNQQEGKGFPIGVSLGQSGHIGGIDTGVYNSLTNVDCYITKTNTSVQQIETNPESKKIIYV